MILVAGGQLDPNIGFLLRRILERGCKFRDILVSSELKPQINIDLTQNIFTLNGEEISPTACFIRHDVFASQSNSETLVQTEALNWFYTIRGWSISQKNVKCFNRLSNSIESNKIRNLIEARIVGLEIPTTIITNCFDETHNRIRSKNLIQKPVAGGDLTTLLSDYQKNETYLGHKYPRFLQPCLSRPEYRIYKIGEKLLGFRLDSDDLDYRENQNVKIEPYTPNNDICTKLNSLCYKLGLDFAAADFMHDPQSENLVFLEINSQPMFAAFDRVVDGKLCDLIINYLEDKTLI